MEAPEKVYLLFNRPYLVDYAKLNKRRCDEEIEYSRTDAFIEKACEYLQRNLWRVVDEEPEFRQRFVTDFEIYMKGE